MNPSCADTTQVHWHDTPPSPAQVAAWDALWRRLLGAADPQTTEAPGGTIPEASDPTMTMDGRQAAGTATTPPVQEAHRYGK